MKYTFEFPLSIGQTLYYANFKRFCVDKVFVAFVTFSDLGVLIGLKDTEGDLLKPKHKEDLGVTLFEDEDSANCAVLARGGDQA